VNDLESEAIREQRRFFSKEAFAMQTAFASFASFFSKKNEEGNNASSIT